MSTSTFFTKALVTITTLVFLALSIVVVTFSSLSVLCVLIRPGPGEGGGQRRPADPSKKRAFLTIMIIFCTVWLWFAVLVVLVALDQSSLISEDVECYYSFSSLVEPANLFGDPFNVCIFTIAGVNEDWLEEQPA